MGAARGWQDFCFKAMLTLSGLLLAHFPGAVSTGEPPQSGWTRISRGKAQPLVKARLLGGREKEPLGWVGRGLTYPC